MVKDEYGQEITEGDWIAAPLPGAQNMAIGKVSGFTKNNNPKFKKSNNSSEFTCMLRQGHDGKNWVMKAKFVKIIPTKEIDLYYENN